MTTYVALLPGVNVGGHRRVPIAEFRALLEALPRGRPTSPASPPTRSRSRAAPPTSGTPRERAAPG
jgi:hypothetical protein